MQHIITREIGIDMGHRVTYHASKCKNLHGHRYTVHATCKGPLFVEGEQAGMVLDFGFLKEEMMDIIDACCDHGTTLWIDDPFVKDFLPDEGRIKDAQEKVAKQGYCLEHSKFGKLYLVPYVPTAENLAKHWYERLRERVQNRTDNQATLLSIKVWETPNCSAEFPVRV